MANNRREGRRAQSASARAVREASDRVVAEQQGFNPENVGDDEVIRPQSAGEKVVVACKLGVGWFDLQICEKRSISENTQVGPRSVDKYVRLPGVIRIRGTAYPRGTPPAGYPERPETYEGFAITRGVDRDFFETWMDQNRRAPYVVNGLIFGGAEDMVRGKARELKARLSGLEPLDPNNNDPRIPKPTNVSVSRLESGSR